MERLSYTTEEVAKLLRISKLTVYDLIKKGKLPAYRVGRQMRVDESDLEAFKESNKKKAFVAAEMTPAISAEHPFVISGQDYALDLLIAQAETRALTGRCFRTHQSSMDSLLSLYRRQCKIACTHLWDADTNDYNTPFIRRFLPGEQWLSVTLVERSIGFLVQRDNPKRIREWHDLLRQDVTMVNRERGSGVRILLDAQLQAHSLAAAAINGYEIEAHHHTEVAKAVLMQKADVGIGSFLVARMFGLSFIPLQKERYDLVFLREDWEQHPDLKKFADTIQSRDFRHTLHELGYDAALSGEIVESSS